MAIAMFSHKSLAAMLLVGMLAGVQAQDVAVSAKEIQDTWVGKTMSGRLPNGGPVSMQFRPDGTGKLVVAAIPYPGTWRISDVGYCTSWLGIRAGQERCFTVKRSGTAFVVINPDGTEGGRFTEIE
jgi:hypothetical protein